MLAGIGLMLAATMGVAADSSPVVAGYERFHRSASGETAAIAGGLLLLNELNCVACHQAPDTWRGQLPGRGKVRLADVGSRLEPHVMGAFVAQPHRVKPGTTMPDVLHGDATAAETMAAYLSTLRRKDAPGRFPAGDVARGRKLYGAVGCVACHAPEPAQDSPGAVPLALAPQYPEDELAAFLRNPLHTRPAGRMPAFELSENEAADLAAFLRQALAVNPALPAKEPGRGPVDTLRVAQGRELFVSRGCAACHDDGGHHPVIAAVPLAGARGERGCLAEHAGAAAPHFALDPTQRTAIRHALRALQAGPPSPLSAEQSVARTFEQLNCYACHEWRGRGGIPSALAAHFAVGDPATESLGEAGRLPPKLDQAGRKLTPAWLAKLLWGEGGGVRPYLTARMPRFGEGNAAGLLPALTEACRPAKPLAIDTSGTKGHQRFATGLTLIGTGDGGLGCVACHGLKEREPPGVRAINLTHTVQRLQPEYFKALLLDPQGMQPGTIMPPLFAARKNADREIESLWTYLKEMDQSPRLPDGLQAPDSFELRPENEGRPIVFRTFLEGAGVHAIAVGFPARLHVAFDALEVRWALIWRGRFLDAMANWEDRMMPAVKPLGEAVRMLPAHVALARLREGTDPWPTKWGTDAGYTFKGYRLGPDGTPVFRYQVGDLSIEDVLQPHGDGNSLQRRITVRGGGEGWFFRGSAAGAMPQPVVFKQGQAVLEERITF